MSLWFLCIPVPTCLVFELAQGYAWRKLEFLCSLWLLAFPCCLVNPHSLPWVWLPVGHAASKTLCLPRFLHIDAKNHYISNNQIASDLHLLRHYPQANLKIMALLGHFILDFKQPGPAWNHGELKWGWRQEVETLSSDSLWWKMIWKTRLEWQ